MFDADTIILFARQANVKVWLGGMPRRIKEQRKKTLIVESRQARKKCIHQMRGNGTSSQATLIRCDSSLKNTL